MLAVSVIYKIVVLSAKDFGINSLEMYWEF